MGESAKFEVDYQEELKSAIEARDEFLKEYPDLQPFQDELNRILSKAENRIEALAFLLEKKLSELGNSLADLQTFLKQKYDEVSGVDVGGIPDDYESPTGYLN